MHHLLHLITNPFVIVGFIVLMTYHHLPKKTWIPFGKFFTLIWKPVSALDRYLFEVKIEVEEIKKSRFKKIVSPFGKLLLLLIAFVIYIGDELFISPATKLVNRIIESESMKKVILWIENRNIYILRVLVGVPFLLMEITGILAGFILLSNPLLGIFVYLSKFLWVIPFKFIDKVGHDKLSNDPWYSGLKASAVKVIDAVKNLEAMKRLHNMIVAVKNFLKDSNHNTSLEVKIRKKLLMKALSEAWSLRHFSDELSEADDIEVIVFTPEITKKLELLKQNPDNQLLREEIMDYVISETTKSTGGTK